MKGKAMKLLDHFIDRLCLAIYLRGHRAWLEPRLREAEKKRPRQRTAAEIKATWERKSFKDCYAEELIRQQIAEDAHPASREWPTTSLVRRNNLAEQSPAPSSHALES